MIDLIVISKLDHEARTCENIWSIIKDITLLMYNSQKFLEFCLVTFDLIASLNSGKKITNFKFNIFKITYLKKKLANNLTILWIKFMVKYLYILYISNYQIYV